MVMRRRTWTLALLILLAVPTVLVGTWTLVLVLTPETISPEEATAAFREGVAAFEQGDYEVAEASFARALQGLPNDRTARNWRDEAGFRFWIDTLAQKRAPELARTTRQILQLAERATIAEERR